MNNNVNTIFITCHQWSSLENLVMEKVADILHKRVSLRGKSTPFFLLFISSLLPLDQQAQTVIKKLTNHFRQLGVHFQIARPTHGEETFLDHQLIYLENGLQELIAITSKKDVYGEGKDFSFLNFKGEHMNTIAIKPKTNFNEKPLGLWGWVKSLFIGEGEAPTLPLAEDHPTKVGMDVLPPRKPLNTMFFNALAEGTNIFAQRYIGQYKSEEFDDENEHLVFDIEEVRICLSNAPREFVMELVAIPAEVRDRMIRNRLKKTHPASDWITVDNFFGSSIITDEVITVNDKVVEVMAFYYGAEFRIKLQFVGNYRMIKDEKSTQPQSIVKKNLVQVQSIEQAETTINEDFDEPPSIEESMKIPLGNNTAIKFQDETPIRLNEGYAETPIREEELTSKAVAKLIVRSNEKEIELTLEEGDFPYLIGRHYSKKGYSVRGAKSALDGYSSLLDEVEGEGFSSFVSRNHFEIINYDASCHQIRFRNDGRNKSYFNDREMDKLGIVDVRQMANGRWIRLGGNKGKGILEIRIQGI